MENYLMGVSTNNYGWTYTYATFMLVSNIALPGKKCNFSIAL